MRLAALCSGGKDSIHAMYLAHQSGHEIPYLVGIASPGDSWMFHTPNVGLVPLMAEAMELEFVGGETDGTEEGDMAALKDALSGLDVEGVVMGGIWSDYQWDRINAVCGNLDLFVCAPLWRKDQDAVFDEMVDAGIEAVVVGTFAEGLGRRHLGRVLDGSFKEDIEDLRRSVGLSITGEGGEYESFVTDSPMHRRRISIRRARTESGRSFSLLSVEEAVLEEKRQN